MFSRPKIFFLVSLLFVALLNPKFNPYLLFKFLIFYHIYTYTYINIYNIYVYIRIIKYGMVRNCTASGKFRDLKINLAIGFTRKNQLECIGKAVMMLYLG